MTMTPEHRRVNDVRYCGAVTSHSADISYYDGLLDGVVTELIERR